MIRSAGIKNRWTRTGECIIKRIKKAALAALVATVGLSALPATAATVLTYGEPSPNRGARPADLQWFADQVEKRSGGDLKINILWGGALFKAKAARQSVATGVADMGSIIQAYFPKEMVSYSIGDLPFVNQDAWVGIRTLNDHMQNPAIKAQLAKQNLSFVAPYTVSKVVLVCKGETVRSLDDVKGKKVRGVTVRHPCIHLASRPADSNSVPVGRRHNHPVISTRGSRARLVWFSVRFA